MTAPLNQPAPEDAVTPPADAPYSVIGLTGIPGKLLLCPCPGRWAKAAGEPTVESAARDLKTLADAGATAVLSLVESKELPGGRDRYAAAVAAAGLSWKHLPIRDFGTPDEAFEQGWLELNLRQRLANGETWAIHCRAGLGRTGLVASRLLIETGCQPAEAIARIRAEHASSAVETQAQSDYLFAIARRRD
jgi:protein-tyrosine phosphatase